MKKVPLVFIIWILVFTIANCEKKTIIDDPNAKPDILFESQVHDFGDVAQYTKVTHIFKFKNTGKKELVITKVRPTCGCTATVLSKKNLLPGEEGEIKTEFSTGRYDGAVSKAIIVQTNVPDKNQIRLTVKANVMSLVTIEPKTISVRNIAMNERQTVTLFVKKGSVGDFEILNIQTNNPVISASFEKISTEDSEYKIQVEIDTEGVKPHIYTGNIDIIIRSAEEEKSIPVNYNINVRPNINVNPSSVTMVVEKGKTFTKPIELTSVNEFHISSIMLKKGNLKYRLVDVIPGKSYLIVLYSKELDAPQVLNDLLIVNTDDPVQKKIEVPLRITIK